MRAAVVVFLQLAVMEAPLVFNMRLQQLPLLVAVAVAKAAVLLQLMVMQVVLVVAAVANKLLVPDLELVVREIRLLFLRLLHRVIMVARQLVQLIMAAVVAVARALLAGVPLAAQ